MFGLLEFLTAYPIWTVILIAIASIAIVYKLIKWGKDTWEKRETFKKQQYSLGLQQQREADEEEERELKEQEKIKSLETSIDLLTAMLQKQQEQIDLLIQSDELNIKAWIKEQHEKWMALQCIDSQSLDLLTQRYSIYQKEGGNSWAEKLINEVKALPLITIIPTKKD